MVVGGIIPPADARRCAPQGVAAVFTPADFDITAIVGRIVDEIRLAHELQPWAAADAAATQPAAAAYRG